MIKSAYRRGPAIDRPPRRYFMDPVIPLEGAEPVEVQELSEAFRRIETFADGLIEEVGALRRLLRVNGVPVPKYPKVPKKATKP